VAFLVAPQGLSHRDPFGGTLDTRIMSPLNSLDNQLVTKQGDQKLPGESVRVRKAILYRGLELARLLDEVYY